MAQLKVLRPLGEAKLKDYRKTCNLGKILRSIVWVLAVVSIVFTMILPAISFKTTIKSGNGKKEYLSAEFKTSSLETLTIVIPKIVDSISAITNPKEKEEKSLEDTVKELKGKEITNAEKLFNMSYAMFLVEENVREIPDDNKDTALEWNAHIIKTFTKDVEAGNIKGINEFLKQARQSSGGYMPSDEQLNELKGKYLIGSYANNDNLFGAILSDVSLYDASDVEIGDMEGVDIDAIVDAVPTLTFMFASGYLMLVIVALVELLFLVVPVIRLLIYLVYQILLLCGVTKSITTTSIGIFVVLVPILALLPTFFSIPFKLVKYSACTVSTLGVFSIVAVVCALAAKIIEIIFNHKIRKLNVTVQM